MKLSYAQNLEDYHLSLLFAGEMAGTYVDVGGGHPVADNVSFYFYLMGWRGLVVEPQTKLASTYAHVRPRDHTVSMLAGATDGEIDFHTVDKLHGFSTTVEANASGARAYGVGYTTTRLAVRRLSTLIDEAKLEKIDFLKIDVEGAEADVLAGLDWRRHRPRVILVEAVEPGSMVDASAKWEQPDHIAGLLVRVLRQPQSVLRRRRSRRLKGAVSGEARRLGSRRPSVGLRPGRDRQGSSRSRACQHACRGLLGQPAGNRPDAAALPARARRIRDQAFD